MKNTGKKSIGYYNEKILGKFMEALNDAKQDVKDQIETQVRFSLGNSKMGPVPSVSTLPFITCPECCKETCGPKCYAAKIANCYKETCRAYAINTALAIYKPIEYWNQINDYCKGVRYFRFHVSGDIMNKAYFHHMVDVALDNSKTEILAFTKQFKIVNDWISENGELPENMHILFSGWQNLDPINPHRLPETNVFTCEADFNDDWKVCGENCFNCACRGVGCWQAMKGDVIAFKMH